LRKRRHSITDASGARVMTLDRDITLADFHRVKSLDGNTLG
jgi:hypothetical protein